jgi:acetyl esterase/lipase
MTNRFPLWPGFAPGETTIDHGHDIDEGKGQIIRLGDVTAPEITVYPLATDELRPCIVVFPGGGYHILAADLEGSEIAEWFNRAGYAAAVVHYRCPDKRDGAYQDAQRAVSWVRAHASEYGIDANAVGVLGFSAGGHLVTRLAVGNEERTYAPVDGADAFSCRPDFAIPVYPAFLLDKETGQPAPEVAPHPLMPPVFFSQPRDDGHFCIEAYAAAAKEVGAPVTAEIYETGGHGYGVRLAPEIPASAWPDDTVRWLAATLG